ncbi:MAG: hypothetical protein JO288_06840 [Hyphomicrobiales bacterium]|nr:hypothetical protein [Hyphomicrobiales bacterium]
MTDEQLALVLGAVVFAGGAIGLALQRVLPERFTTGGPRDMIGAVVGLFTLLSALVLGLLIWTAYGVYSSQNTAIQTLAAKVLQLDLALVDYGSDADAGRAQLRQELAGTIKDVWGADQAATEFAARNFADAIDNMSRKQSYLESLSPSTDKEKQALAAAQQTIGSIGQSRLQMSFALESPVSYPLIYLVIGWGTGLFCGFGLMSRGNAMSIVVLAFGALAIASAVYAILDLSSPYSGIFRASPAPLEQVLAYMGQERGAVGAAR